MSAPRALCTPSLYLRVRLLGAESHVRHTSWGEVSGMAIAGEANTSVNRNTGVRHGKTQELPIRVDRFVTFGPTRLPFLSAPCWNTTCNDHVHVSHVCL